MSAIGLVHLLLYLLFPQQEEVFCLHAMTVVNVILNLIPLDQLVKFTSFLATVLEGSHFDLVVDLGHLGDILSHGLDARNAASTELRLNLVMLRICVQNGVFLRLLEHLRRAHLHTSDVDFVLDRKFFE